MKCKICGFEINEEHKFCANCGTSIMSENQNESQNSIEQQTIKNTPMNSNNSYSILNVSLSFIIIIVLLPKVLNSIYPWITMIECIKSIFSKI